MPGRTSLEPGDRPTFEDTDDTDALLAAVEENIQSTGAQAFHQFSKRVNSLEKQLRNFADSARQLGSSAAVFSTAFKLRTRLAHVLHIYRINAMALFPRKLKRTEARKQANDPAAKVRKRILGRLLKMKENAIESQSEVAPVDIEDLPTQLLGLAEDLIMFLKSLNEFPEFRDDQVQSSIESFERDLKYWGSCLKEYHGQFKYPGMQRYIHDISSEMGEHLDSVSTTISIFIEVGVPNIRFHQKHGAANLTNLSTVSTFLSAVTATTLQFSYQAHDTTVSILVNTFWFASLVFSIGAVVNSLLGLTWRLAIYRSPGNRVPQWVLIWIKHSPLVFLVMSLACFSAGLCAFTYSSAQARVTQEVTTACTVLTSFGLLSVAAWFGLERWIYAQYDGHKWLSDILAEQHTLLARHTDQFMQAAARTRTARTVFYIFHWIWDAISQKAHRSAEDNVGGNGAVATRVDDLEANHHETPTPADATPPTEVDNRKTFKRWAQSVTHATGIQTRVQAAAKLRSRFATLKPRLSSMRVVMDASAHEEVVKEAQFSPDGTTLISSSWDRTSVLYSVETMEVVRQFAHTKGFVRQISWSPSGEFLLTRLLRAIQLWKASNGVCQDTFPRLIDSASIVWLPGSESFLSAESNLVYKLAVTGEVIGQYDLGHVNILDLCATGDSSRLLAVGQLLESPNGSNPSKSRKEKRLILYNMQTSEVEHKTPVLSDVRAVRLSHSVSTGDIAALISFNGSTPPQLWRMETDKGPYQPGSPKAARLALRHTFMPETAVEYTGCSIFGGDDNQFIVSAGKAGDIHIWDRESGVLLHHMRAFNNDTSLTCFTWRSCGSGPFMFAAGTEDGHLRLWKEEESASRESTGE